MLGNCHVTVDILLEGEKAWTDSDEDVKEGDEIDQGTVVHVGLCREW